MIFVGRARGGFARDLGEDLLLLVGQLVPHVRRDLRRQAVDDVRGHHDRLLHFVEFLGLDRRQRIFLRVDGAVLQREVDLGERDRRRIGAAGLRRRHVGRHVRHADLQALHAGAIGERLLRRRLPRAVVRVRE